MATTQEVGTSWDEGRKFGLILREQVPFVWIEVLTILLERGEEWLKIVDEHEVLACLVSGDYELWLARDNGNLDGYVICQWENHARKRRYHILHIAGDGLRKYLTPGLRKIEYYACMCGADEVVFSGRPGWQRLLTRYGYNEKYVVVGKPVRTMWSN